MSDNVTHDLLVQKAQRWLESTMGCGFSFTELNTSIGYVPDAVGFKGTTSILVECKTSRNDFHAGKKKMQRNLKRQAVGDYRYYLSPPDVVQEDDLPDKWGLLHLKGSRVYKIKHVLNPKGGNIPCKEYRFDANKRNERLMMYSALRRLKIRDRLKEIYEYPPKRN